MFDFSETTQDENNRMGSNLAFGVKEHTNNIIYYKIQQQSTSSYYNLWDLVIFLGNNDKDKTHLKKLYFHILQLASWPYSLLKITIRSIKVFVLYKKT